MESVSTCTSNPSTYKKNKPAAKVHVHVQSCIRSHYLYGGWEIIGKTKSKTNNYENTVTTSIQLCHTMYTYMWMVNANVERRTGTCMSEHVIQGQYSI